MKKFESLVETEWLKKNLSNCFILDGSWYLPNQNRNAYEEYSVLRAIEGANFNICNYRVQLTGETEKKLINIVLY